MISMLVAITWTSCDSESTAGYDRITYYPDFTILDGPTTLIPLGTTYADAGVIVMEGETDITSSVKVSGEVNTAEIGVYSIVYSAMNVDGMYGSATRTVCVYDPNNTTADISETYTLAAGSYRLHATAGKTPFSGYNVAISQIGPGVYYCSDLLGGYYQYFVKYGAAYALKGYFMINNDNSIEGLSGYLAGWGDSFSSIAGEYDPVSGKIQLATEYAGMTFYLTFEK